MINYFNHKQFHAENRGEVEKCRDPSAVRALYREWLRSGSGRFSVRRIKLLRKRAQQLHRQANPANALALYWSIEELFSPVEERIDDIVADYDNWINLQIDIARGK